MNSISTPRLNFCLSSWCTCPRHGTVLYIQMRSGWSHQHRMEFPCLWPCFLCFCRMDDIQLCKDIMNLKKELQSLVAIPGNAYLQPSIGIMLGWHTGEDGVKNTPLPLTIKNFPLRLSFISLSSHFFLPVFLPIFNLLVSKFLFMLCSLLPWQQTCKYHQNKVHVPQFLHSLGNLKGTKWHGDCQAEKTECWDTQDKREKGERFITITVNVIGFFLGIPIHCHTCS